MIVASIDREVLQLVSCNNAGSLTCFRLNFDSRGFGRNCYRIAHLADIHSEVARVHQIGRVQNDVVLLELLESFLFDNNYIGARGEAALL